MEDSFDKDSSNTINLQENGGEPQEKSPFILNSNACNRVAEDTSVTFPQRPAHSTAAVSAEDNLGLVHSIAHRFAGRGIEYEELYSAGCLGLAKAVKRFDKSRGLRFSTYAFPLIMGEIRGLFRQSGTVKVSRTLKEIAVKAARFSSEYENAHNSRPTVSELADMLGVSEELTVQALCAANKPISLTAGEDDEDGGTRDIPVDSDEERIAEILSLRDELSRLDEDDRALISLRYYRGMTQSRTAQVLGTTQVQISRREKKILSALRENLL